VIEKRTGIKPVLKKGSGGIFDVEVDGKRIFSKHESGRFPRAEEILDELTT
jgi:selenoprotein W-related protein